MEKKVKRLYLLQVKLTRHMETAYNFLSLSERVQTMKFEERSFKVVPISDVMIFNRFCSVHTCFC